MFLTKDELIILTGKKQAKAQIAFLTENSFKFVINAAGKPVVLKDEVKNKIAGFSDKMGDSVNLNKEPDFKRINE